MTSAADVIAATLAAAGVEKVFGVVGTSTLDLVDAIAREPRLEFVAARAEEAAAHMADGYAPATGRIGVTLAHVGPGALRQLSGVGTAWKDSVPLLAKTLALTDSELREGYHVVEVQDLYRPVTKATLRLRSARDAAHAVQRALWTAASGRPGPVLLDVSKDIAKAPVERPPQAEVAVVDRTPASRVAAHPDDVRWVATALGRSSSPVVLAGGGIHWSGAHEALAALAEAANLPVLTTDGGRGSLPEDHPQLLGVLARQAGDATARALLAEADVVVALGTPLSDVSTFEWSAWSEETTVIQVDISPDPGRRGLVTTRQVVADAREFLTSLTDALTQRHYRFTGSWAGPRSALDAERRIWRRPNEGGDNGRVDPRVLIDELEVRLPRDAFISVDSGLHSFYGKKLRVLEPRSYLRSAGFGAMGYSFSAVLGALEGRPGRRGVAIVGDGCLAMCLGEFETAARRGSAVTLVVYNDARFASQQYHQHRRFGERVVGTTFQETDFVKIAAAQGVRGWIVDDDSAARAAVQQALALAGPSVIDARIDADVRPPTWIEGSGDTRTAAGRTTYGQPP